MLFIFDNAYFIMWGDLMTSKNKKKIERTGNDEAEQKIERETGDIYDAEQRGEMLTSDGITAAENAFMQGRKMNIKKRKMSSHKDTVSVNLAAEEYTED